MSRKNVEITEEEYNILLKIQKESIEIIAKYESLIHQDNRFEVCATALGFIICNFLDHYGVKDPAIFMKDISNNINSNYNNFIKNANYEFVVYENGKKICKGKLN